MLASTQGRECREFLYSSCYVDTRLGVHSEQECTCPPQSAYLLPVPDVLKPRPTTPCWCSFWTSCPHHVNIPKCIELLPCDWPTEPNKVASECMSVHMGNCLIYPEIKFTHKVIQLILTLKPKPFQLRDWKYQCPLGGRLRWRYNLPSVLLLAVEGTWGWGSAEGWNNRIGSEGEFHSWFFGWTVIFCRQMSR